jgi:hypothetical protein
MLKAGFEKPRYCRVCGSARDKKRRKEGCMMKKIISVLVVLLLAAPAMGALSVTCAQGDDGECIVSYGGADNDANRPRAFALGISLSGGAVVVTEPTANYDADYYIYPGSITISGGNVTSWGTPVANDPNTGAGYSTMTIEMGSLYATSDTKHSSPPPASGELFRFTVDADTTVSITENAIRGKVVKENGGNYPSLDTQCDITVNPCGTCPMDISGWEGEGIPDGYVTMTDVMYLLGVLEGCDGGECDVTTLEPAEACLDVSGWEGEGIPDGYVTMTDAMYILGVLGGCDGGECECPS